MSVGLKTDRFQLTRAFAKNEKRNARDGSVSVTIKENILVSPGAAERTDTEKNLRIQSEIGHFPVMMDFSEFLNLSDTKRRDFIYSLGGIDSATWTRDRKQKDAQGAVRQISDMKNDMAETDRNIATLKQELETLQNQLISVEKSISADEEKKKAAEKRTARMDRVTEGRLGT